MCKDFEVSQHPDLLFSLFQNMLDGSSVPYMERANPEDFIHLFLNNSERLVEFLEHLVKVFNIANVYIMAG
jgi:hypothetical protein